MMEGKKLRSLLKFYKKHWTEIELKINLKEGVVVRGIIVKINCIFGSFFILRSKEGAPIKIFFDDIVEGTIIPTSFTKGNSEENKKSKKSRSPLSSKLRFDVFRRDKYVCQYCGACGPKVELEVDHVIPVARGGTDDMNNLKTSCFDCNRGKGGGV